MSAKAVVSCTFEPICDPAVVAVMVKTLDEWEQIWMDYFADGVRHNLSATEARDYANRKCRRAQS